jgi:endonuclease-3
MAETEHAVTREAIALVAERLSRAYPYIREVKAAEGLFTDTPLDSLMRAVLSQNTTDRNRDAAFAALQSRYSSWDDVADAPQEALAEVIRVTNYAYTKAGRMQAILRRLCEEHGRATLDFLREWPTDRVLDYLDAFPGIGPKSAAIVALFALDRPVMPVDTHVYRVAQRLGWIGPTTTPERAHAVLRALIPPALVLPLHMGCWEHGRVTCRPVPRCGQCAVYAFCRFPAKTAPEPLVEEAIAHTAHSRRKAA